MHKYHHPSCHGVMGIAVEGVVHLDPCRLKPSEYRSMMIDFIATCELEQIRYLLRKRDTEWTGSEVDVDNTLFHAFNVNATNLIAHNSSLAFSILHHPSLLLPVFDEAVVEMQSSSLIRLANRTQEQEAEANGKSKLLKVKISIYFFTQILACQLNFIFYL